MSRNPSANHYGPPQLPYDPVSQSTHRPSVIIRPGHTHGLNVPKDRAEAIALDFTLAVLEPVMGKKANRPLYEDKVVTITASQVRMVRSGRTWRLADGSIELIKRPTKLS